MPVYSKQSLELLRQRIDLFDVLSSQLDLKRTGTTYKSLCPFHEEKTPSFMIQKGDRHYHCFGCGAHGDAIQFLMTYQRLSFSEAVEQLAQRFNVPLEIIDQKEGVEVNKAQLRDALELACRFYHFFLLEKEEGQEALRYLEGRGVDLNFIRNFQLGLAPKDPQIFRRLMHSKGFNDQLLIDSGLIIAKGNNYKDFFCDRITFPIRASAGYVIGFSGRKYKEETFGGKYVNSPETALFKKSHILFGLNYSRKRIAKEHKVIIVEGQLDCLRLLESGLNITVAAQGTAFGEYHVKELLNLGVRNVYLMFDSDQAGFAAASKVGQLLQKAGVDVYVVNLPDNEDPDSYVRKQGIQALIEKTKESMDYIAFQVQFLSKEVNPATPAGKSELVQLMAKQIRSWDHPIMIHEALRKLAHLLQVPESMIGVGQEFIPQLYIKRSSHIELGAVDSNRILELDLLRWLILLGDEYPQLVETAQRNLLPTHFWVPICRKFYQSYIQAYREQLPKDLLSLLIAVDDEEGQKCADEILHKKINREKTESYFKDTVQKILDRQWLQMREEIKMKIQMNNSPDDDVIALLKEFDEIKKNPPKVM